MTKLVLALAALTAFTPIDIQSTAQQKVQKHIIENIDDPKDYQPLVFGKVEKFMLPFSKTSVGKSYLQSAKISLELAKKNWEQINSAGWSSNKIAMAQQVEEQEKEVQKYLNQYDSASKKYKPAQFGWKLNHKYSLKDPEGNVNLNEDTFYLDMKMRIVDIDTL